MSSTDTGGNGRQPSRTRDHLANERTYLAWLRTATTVMALGLVIAQLAVATGTSAVVAGAILVVVGAVGLVYGTVRYRHVDAQIEHGHHLAGSRRGPVLATTVLLTAVAVSLVLLVVGGSGSG